MTTKQHVYCSNKNRFQTHRSVLYMYQTFRVDLKPQFSVTQKQTVTDSVTTKFPSSVKGLIQPPLVQGTSCQYQNTPTQSKPCRYISTILKYITGI